RLRYSMTLASPCMVGLLGRIDRERGSRGRRGSNLAQNAWHDRRGGSGWGRSHAMQAAWTGLGAGGRGDRLVHDPADGARASATLGTAAQAAIDLAGRARGFHGAECRPHIVVAEHVAGTDDHGNPGQRGRFLVPYATIDTRAGPGRQNQNTRFYSYSNLADRPGREGQPSAQGRTVSTGTCERLDHAFDDLLHQDLVAALAHNPDDRLGPGGAHDQPAVSVEARFRILDGAAHIGILERLAALVAHVPEHLRQRIEAMADLRYRLLLFLDHRQHLQSGQQPVAGRRVVRQNDMARRL